jgi:hypothetical protein
VIISRLTGCISRSTIGPMIHMPRATRTRRTRNCGGSGNCCGPVPLCCVDYIPRAGRRKELDATKATVVIKFLFHLPVPVPYLFRVWLPFCLASGSFAECRLFRALGLAVLEAAKPEVQSTTLRLRIHYRVLCCSSKSDVCWTPRHNRGLDRRHGVTARDRPCAVRM